MRHPVPVHPQPAFRHLGHRAGSFPGAERAARELLGLPPHPHLTEARQERVARAPTWAPTGRRRAGPR
ncbi:MULTISPECIES: DegT/DnrJ/EryC1/StrS family aminotransferase [unclassified Kitasatospora]|uniref:DegT/DnrJ/EryC1/StrS family aminotransferase n=1 Tax=unclassified Kitasatospora TaxID=2633591 RepID=UPI0033C40C43